MKLRKTILALTLALLTALSCVPAMAADAQLPTAAAQAAGDTAAPQAEETVWYTRMYEGRLQKRLWSITYGRWLTDWIDVGSNP